MTILALVDTLTIGTLHIHQKKGAFSMFGKKSNLYEDWYDYDDYYDDVLRGYVGPRDEGFEEVSNREDEEAEKSSV